VLPSVLSSQVRRGIEDFLRTTFPIHTPAFEGVLERLLEAAAVARIGRRRCLRHRQSRTSMAARSPSLTMLKHIEVTKIAAPGAAQTQGWT